MTWMSYVALVVFAYWLLMLVVHLQGLPKIPSVPMVEQAENEPLLSVIVAGKEEEDAIAETLRGLLRQSYGKFEIIAVNDRSEDRTGERMEEVKAWAAANGFGHIQLEVVHIEALPDGWLGKNHALYEGTRRAKGELLLFTDADVRFQPHAIRSAVAFFRRLQLDHLTISPFLSAKSVVLRAFVQFFLFSLSMLKRMWKPNDDKQHDEGFGIGAFNLLSRDAYEKIGTHRAIANRPDDDLQLGLRIKRARLKQRLATGKEHIVVEWYPNVRAAVRGLEKNLFAGLNYSIAMFIAGFLGQMLFFFWPFVAVWVSSGFGQVLYALAVLFMIVLYVLYVYKMTAYSGMEVLILPFTVLLFVFVLTRSVYLTLKQGGIYWRGTFYSLEELKRMS